MATQRNETIDCAKSIGIMLVVFAHIIATHKVGWGIEEVITSFHMPLFFVLSGMFFSRKTTFEEFVIGKVNRLIIPFFFFFITISVVVPVVYYLYKGNLSRIPDLLLGFYNENLFIVGAIWFLLSLFFVYILFWLVTIPQKRQTASFILFSAVLGVVGYVIGTRHLDLPFWLDTSLTCMPYFAIGYLLKNKTTLLSAKIPDLYNILLSIGCLIVVILSAGHTCYRANHYDISIWQVYACGVFGFFAVYFLSNTTLNKSKYLQYIGKNSIIILAVHQLIMTGISILLKHIDIDGWWSVVLNFTITMAISTALIPLMLRYLPHITGQKNIISAYGKR